MFFDYVGSVLSAEVTPTIQHLAKAIGLLYLYLVGLNVTVRVSYGYVSTIPAGRVGSTDINARCVRSNSLRKLREIWGLSCKRAR